MPGSAEDSRTAVDTFPLPTSMFVGRRDELERALALLKEESLYLVYGLAGIGKTEFVYRLVELARGMPRWSEAPAVLIRVREGQSIDDVLAMLRFACGEPSAPTDLAGDTAGSVADDLERLVRVLDASAWIVVLDDLHRIGVEAASRAIGFLGRRVRRSRIICTSRVEIPVSSECAVPVTIRLPPLDETESVVFSDAIARRLGIVLPDPQAVTRRARGSPFLIQREVVALAEPRGGDEDVLEASLRSLSAEVQRALLTLAVTPDDSLTLELVDDEAVLGVLFDRFLVERRLGHFKIHDLVRDAVLRRSSRTMIEQARDRVARRLCARFQSARVPFDAVEAVRQFVRAARHAEALRCVVASYRDLSAVGLDHLLVPALQELRVALPGATVSIDLYLARIQIRRSLIDEAQETLARLGRDRKGATSWRYLALAGTVAQRLGELARAEDFFQRARRHARDPADRARLSLALAMVLALRGELRAAERLLDKMRPAGGGRPASEPLRWSWARILCLLLEQRFAEAVEVAEVARRQTPATQQQDVLVLAAMLESLARAETDDIDGARRLIDDVIDPAVTRGGLREQIANLFRGVVWWAEGQLHRARVALEESYGFMKAHRDEVTACVVGHYLGRTVLALGDVRRAQLILDETTARAEQLGLVSLAPAGAVLAARAALSAGAPERALAACEALRARAPVSRYALRAASCIAAIAHAMLDHRAEASAHLDAALQDITAEPETLLDAAEVAMMLQRPDAVIECAARALTYFTERKRAYLQARACVSLAAGYAASTTAETLPIVPELLGRADELIASTGAAHLALRAGLVRMAVALRRGDRTLADSLRCELIGRADSMMLRLLLAGEDTKAPSGILNVLHFLGLAPVARFEIVAHESVLLGTAADIERQRQQRDLMVDLDAGTLFAKSSGTTIKGRPVVCGIIAALVGEKSAVVSAEVLYRRAWGVAEYHPLRHANSLYVAINRTRKVLERLLGRNDAIESLPGGWRLADGLDICVVRAANTRADEEPSAIHRSSRN